MEGHHIVHWANGGETSLNNLVLRCGRDHRAVHELGYRIQRSGEPGARFEFVKSRLGSVSQRLSDAVVPSDLLSPSIRSKDRQLVWLEMDFVRWEGIRLACGVFSAGRTEIRKYEADITGRSSSNVAVECPLVRVRVIWSAGSMAAVAL